MVWSVHDRAWEDGLAMARRYAAEHGTLAAPKDAVIEGYPVGRWLEKRRAQGKAGTLAGERDVALDALVDGEEWNPAHWTPDWQRHLTCARQLPATHAEAGGGLGLDDVGPAVVAADGWPEDVRLGVWVTTTRNRRAKLPAERIAALDAVGMRWT